MSGLGAYSTPELERMAGQLIQGHHSETWLFKLAVALLVVGVVVVPGAIFEVLRHGLTFLTGAILAPVIPLCWYFTKRERERESSARFLAQILAELDARRHS